MRLRFSNGPEAVPRDGSGWQLKRRAIQFWQNCLVGAVRIREMRLKKEEPRRQLGPGRVAISRCPPSVPDAAVEDAAARDSGQPRNSTIEAVALHLAAHGSLSFVLWARD